MTSDSQALNSRTVNVKNRQNSSRKRFDQQSEGMYSSTHQQGTKRFLPVEQEPS